MNASIANTLVRTTGIWVEPEQVVTHGESSYSVEGIQRRDTATHIAASIMQAFATDPESGLPEVAVRKAPISGTFYVRVVID